MVLYTGTRWSDFYDTGTTVGDDQLYGRGGDDVLHSGTGNDTLYGNLGDDTLFGNLGDDSLYGGRGNDGLVDLDGNNVLVGGLGNDSFISVGTAYGGPGDDSLRNYGGDAYGGKGNDTLQVDFSDDIRDHPGDHNLSGGPGSDVFVLEMDTAIFPGQRVDVLDLRPGIDKVTLLSWSPDDGEAHGVRIASFDHNGDHVLNASDGTDGQHSVVFDAATHSLGLVFEDGDSAWFHNKAQLATSDFTF